MLEENVGGSWVDTEVAVDGVSIVVPANGLIKLDIGESRDANGVDSPMTGFSGWNSLGVVASSVGQYRVYASFSTGGQVVETSWEFVVA